MIALSGFSRENGAPVYYEETLGSTNTELKKLALQGFPSGTVLAAGTQTEGRGRMGRSFLSPEGGIYCSMLLKFPEFDRRLLSVTALAAVAAAEALETAAGCGFTIKWPNDIECGGKKICGILTEAVSSGFGVDIVVGIGVNLNTASFPEELAGRAGSVWTETDKNVDPSEFLRMLINSLDRRFSLLPEAEDDCLAEYRRRCSTVGKQLPDGSTVTGVDTDYSLLLRLPDGSAGRKFFGEVMQ